MFILKAYSGGKLIKAFRVKNEENCEYDETGFYIYKDEELIFRWKGHYLYEDTTHGK